MFNRQPPRRMQQQQQRQQHQQQQHQQQQHQQQQHQQQHQQQQQQNQQLQQPPQPPQNLADLRRLLQQYGPMLNAENRAFITELITKLEQGHDMPGLIDLAQRMQKATRQS